jgi:hypothetical protein
MFKCIGTAARSAEEDQTEDRRQPLCPLSSWPQDILPQVPGLLILCFESSLASCESGSSLCYIAKIYYLLSELYFFYWQETTNIKSGFVELC